MAHPNSQWTDELTCLVACGLLPKVPASGKLRQSADAAMKPSVGPASGLTSPGEENIFHSSKLYHAIYKCIEEDGEICQQNLPAAALIITSVAMEDYACKHSTKARLLASQHARITRAMADQEVAAKKSKVACEHEELVRFLLSANPKEVVDKLLDVLGEPEEQRKKLMVIVSRHGPVDLAAILLATKRAFATGDTSRADGTGSKTLGGLFFREEKRYKASLSRAAIQAMLPPLPALRSYQRDMVGMVLLSWGLELPSEVFVLEDARGAGGGGDVEMAESEEMLRSRWLKLADCWNSNWLVSSPPNSGKTRMFVEVARGVIQSKPPGKCALVVVLVPSVILTTQHAVVFDLANLPGTLVGAYSSDNQLMPKVWRALFIAAFSGSHSSVVVATAESFANLLKTGKAMLSEVDLLVFDEVHHCKDDHPYAIIMSIYNSMPQTARRPRVLGVSASPSSEKNMATLDRRMEELLRRLNARLHLVDSEDSEVAAILPEPTHLEMWVAVREIDQQVVMILQDFAMYAAAQIGKSLRRVQAEGSTAMADKEQLVQALEAAMGTCFTTLSSPGRQMLVNALDPLGQWLSKAREFAEKYPCPNLDLTARLLDVVRKAIELVEDAGVEGALPFLGRKAAVLCREEVSAHGGVFNRASRTLPPCPKSTNWRILMLSAAVAAVPAPAAAPAGAPGAVGAAATSRDSPRILSSLTAASSLMPTARGLAIREQDTGAVATSPPDSDNRCGDIQLRVSSLLQHLLISRDISSRICDKALAEDCFASGELKETTFPKFWALLQYLQRYRDKPNFHGIVFVRTRQAVFHVADKIRRAAQLQFVEVLELIGHNSVSRRRGLSLEEDRHGRGMTDSQQHLVVGIFREPGRKVLVATSAAEEGLDVPSCEFVVRYNAAATGIQLLQSRGRARQRAAEFCAILQEGAQDVELHNKSRLEEANMHQWQRNFAESRGAACVSPGARG
ncbi:hypothetical protein Vafri_16281 [Volvox africanus]|uniref:RNA helicase n=1 Tax=Volvox africanus TaxID=51714 RepID=A0A8J4BMY2_9CHLO|nr:hypothetical protein Vafri_16281 [Volvox africanus]